MHSPFHVRIADWTADRLLLRTVREQVFVHEQGVPLEEEWDAEDSRCTHVIALTPQGGAIGTGRLLRDGHIGRMAVLATWRRRGVASAIMQRLLDLARQAGHAQVRLHAQSYVVAFYERHGFHTEGDEFLEVGIPHRQMSKPL